MDNFYKVDLDTRIQLGYKFPVKVIDYRRTVLNSKVKQNNLSNLKKLTVRPQLILDCRHSEDLNTEIGLELEEMPRFDLFNLFYTNFKNIDLT